MFDEHDYGKSVVIASGKDILEACRSNEVIRSVVPEQYEMLLPRVRMEKVNLFTDGKRSTKNMWFLECWWRSSGDGTLGYYTKWNLETGMIKEIRELDGSVSVPDESGSAAGTHYLERCAVVVNDILADKKDAEALDRLWQTAVSAELCAFAMEVPADHTLGSYLLPLEALTCWNWETLKTMLLKRYNTTQEDILDYIAYKDSGSDERYIEPKYREMAKKEGLRFWRDGHDI